MFPSLPRWRRRLKTSGGWSCLLPGPECVCFTFSGPLTKPVHSPSRRPTKILRFQFVSHSVGHGSRGVALDSSDWTSGRLGERRRLQLGLAPKPPTQRPTEPRRRRRRDPGGRRQQAAAAAPAQPRPRSRASQAHRSQQPAGAHSPLGAQPRFGLFLGEISMIRAVCY